ncbi:hypothetical protein, partial [Corynebacterium diphtheriae]|uniref:hypothetical protein n=1 Tax=Corynebacterium diphtheriae TaxID=1717 RepID=UPI0040415B7E
MFVVFSYSRLRKPMVGAWVWAWWCWDFRGHGFVITDSWSWFRTGGFQTREHTNNQPLLPNHCTGEQAGPAGER